MKLPYFRFYPADFVMGTRTMTSSEAGAYIFLLCHQWDIGFVPDLPKELAAIGRCSRAVALRVFRSKFPQCTDGKFRNTRLEHERELALKDYLQKCEAGRKGGKNRWHRHDAAMTPPPSRPCQSESESESLQTEKPLPEADRPGIEEVKFYALQIGLAEWKALDWLDEMNGGGWLDYSHRPIADWRAVLRRVRTKWEADGRPTAPPGRPAPGPPSQGATTADKILHQKEYERVCERLRVIKGQYDHFQTWSDEDKAEWNKHLKRKKELKAILGITL